MKIEPIENTEDFFNHSEWNNNSWGCYNSNHEAYIDIKIGSEDLFKLISNGHPSHEFIKCVLIHLFDKTTRFFLTLNNNITTKDFFALVENEYQLAIESWQFFKSIYEGYGVLLEEIEEVWDAIKSNESSKRISEELIQVGAMCLKMCLSPIW